MSSNFDTLYEDSREMVYLSKALRLYLKDGKTIEDFQKEFECEFIYSETVYGIEAIKFLNEKARTAFYLQYGGR